MELTWGGDNLETKTGYTAAPVEVLAEGGSYGFLKAQIASGATVGKWDYYGSFTRTSLDGYRDYAVQGRDRVNGHLGYVLSENTDIRGFYFFAQVNEQLPGASRLLSWPAALRVDQRTGPIGGDGTTTNHRGCSFALSLGPASGWRSPVFQYPHRSPILGDQPASRATAGSAHENTRRSSGDHDSLWGCAFCSTWTPASSTKRANMRSANSKRTRRGIAVS